MSRTLASLSVIALASACWTKPASPAATGADGQVDDSEIGPGFCVGAPASLVNVCLSKPPSMDLAISTATHLDTASASMCATNVISPNDGSLCVIAATSITIAAALSAEGARPLVLVGSDSITVTVTGSIDVASHVGQVPQARGAGAGSPACAAGTNPTVGGGGFGGSFGSVAGNGGDGNGNGTGGVAGATTVPAMLAGGCAGSSGSGTFPGAGGKGGGAVALISPISIQLDGEIRASGAGGKGGMLNNSGGGGGGAGGLIVVDAPVVAGVSGALIFANGGGGGEGCGGSSGGDGSDPTAPLQAAGGGQGSTTGGDGGTGSILAGAGNAGSNGQSSSGGGGGGGGGGVIRIYGSTTLPGIVSPPAS